MGGRATVTALARQVTDGGGRRGIRSLRILGGSGNRVKTVGSLRKPWEAAILDED